MKYPLLLTALSSLVWLSACNTSMRPENAVSYDQVPPGTRESPNVYDAGSTLSHGVEVHSSEGHGAEQHGVPATHGNPNDPGHGTVGNEEAGTHHDAHGNEVINHEPGFDEQEKRVDDKLENANPQPAADQHKDH